jgi:IS1 family transposase
LRRKPSCDYWWKWAKCAPTIKTGRFATCNRSGCNWTKCGPGFTARTRNRTEEIARKNADAGDVWLWVCIDADSKLVASWRLGQRDLATAKDFVEDIEKRVKGRVQITTDQLRTYLNVIEDTFGGKADYAQLHKIYRASADPDTRYSPAKCIGC